MKDVVPRTCLVPWANQRLNMLALDEDIDLVDSAQQGLRPRGYECSPPCGRETSGAWFAGLLTETCAR